ncbi:MAG: 4Fe-4S dicluster domain-containing protein [Candidatus Methanospirareceae archaeon]
MIAIDALKEEVRKILAREDVKYVIGYEKGTYGFRVSPLFIESEGDLEKLIFSPLCIYNLATYIKFENKERPPLPKGVEPPKHKIALLAKGCDSRAIVQLIAEKGISRDEIIVIGVPCTGVVDIKKLEERFPNVLEGDVIEKGDKYVVICDGEEHELPKDELIADRCKRCEYPNPVLYDVIVGEEVEAKEEDYARVKELEGMSVEERWRYWEEKFSRCIRCYACRNACPLCYCEDCTLEKLRPQWIRRSVNISENTAFHITRAFHLAGRCISCGACENACPMNIPLMELNKKMEKDVKELFGFVPGVDVEEEQLLASYKPDDPEEFIL